MSGLELEAAAAKPEVRSLVGVLFPCCVIYGHQKRGK